MSSADTTLILTNSYDATVDMLLRHLADSQGRIFRLNFDLLYEYDFVLSPEGFVLTDPAGRSITQDTIRKAYYRKPMLRSQQQSLQDYVEEELWAAYQALIYKVWEMEKLVLVEPFAEKSRINKMHQLRVAANIFRVPPTLFSTRLDRHLPDWQHTVTKSLTGGSLGDRTLFTTLVDPRRLDPAYPWLVQQYVEARYDITVVFIRGQLFSFRLDRDFLDDSVDFRAPEDGTTWKAWQYCDMPEDVEAAVLVFMKRLRLDYGRLDFLMTEDEEIYFCEVNPNGQFAWLDPQNSVNLLGTIAYEIDPSTTVHPIPYSPFKE
jgi:hypothetical protein